MWKLTRAEWQYRWHIWLLPFAIALAVWIVVGQRLDFFRGMYWMALVFFSLVPYLTSLCLSWQAFDVEHRAQLWHSTNLHRKQIGRARLLAVAVPWSLSLLMAIAVIWPVREYVTRNGAYEPLAMVVSWSGSCLFFAALLLWLGQKLRTQIVLAAAIICNLHFLVDPILVSAAKVAGAEPYVLNRTIHQATASWAGAGVYFGLALLFGWLFLRHFNGVGPRIREMHLRDASGQGVTCAS